MSVIICFSFFRNIPKTVEPIPRPTKLPGKGGGKQGQRFKRTLSLWTKLHEMQHNGITDSPIAKRNSSHVGRIISVYQTLKTAVKSVSGIPRSVDAFVPRSNSGTLLNIHCVPKKYTPKCLIITSANVDRFSKFFH